MDFVTMYTEVSDRVKVYDSTVSSDLTKIKRWINLAQQDVCSHSNWPFMEYHETIQGVPDTTTGTVDISTGSTSLTFSSAPAVSVANYFIKFSDTDNWYRISAHTAASSSATLSTSFGGDSSISGGTYTLRKLWYATSTPLDSIIYIKETVNGRPLGNASPIISDLFYPLYWDQGSTSDYIISVPDSGGGVQISFIYSPDSKTNFQVKGLKVLADLSSDSDTSLVPERWHSTILDMACFYAFSSVGDIRAKDFYAKAERGMQKMLEVYGYDLGRHRVTRSLGEGVSEGGEYTLPPQYGRVY